MSVQANGQQEAQNRAPMAGVKVLDLATMLAGPFVATILGEFGADVIKVELPGKPGSSRHHGTMTGAGSSMVWLSEQRNKKSITLDLRTPKGREIAKRLISEMDIVVENFMPGTLERWGLGYDVMKQIKPDIILVRVTAYGQTGPYIDRPGFARIAHAFAGLSYLAGEPDGRPVMPGSTSLGDYITGLYGALGALLAYTARNRYGIGQYIDIGLYEGVFRMLDEMISAYAKTGFIRQRLGADTTNHVPHSHYETKDGQWIALACTDDKMWQRMCKAMNREDLLAPDRYATMPQRIAGRAEVNKIVADFCRSMNRDELLAHCLKLEVPIGPINNVADIYVDPHFRARQNFIEMEVPGEGPITIPNVIPRLSETPGTIRSLGPKFGEHNVEIYRDRLGMSEEEIAELRKAGVI
jgi:crotonobetainyl-CoA:carnitine CoA-transferase CaiB-like acyl-CoA transferase